MELSKEDLGVWDLYAAAAVTVVGQRQAAALARGGQGARTSADMNEAVAKGAAEIADALMKQRNARKKSQTAIPKLDPSKINPNL